MSTKFCERAQRASTWRVPCSWATLHPAWPPGMIVATPTQHKTYRSQSVTPHCQPRRGVKGFFDPPRGVAVTPLGQAREPLTPLGSSMAARALLCRTCGQRGGPKFFRIFAIFIFKIFIRTFFIAEFSIKKKKFPQDKKKRY